MIRFYFFLPALLVCLVSCMKQDVPGGDNPGFAPVRGQSLFVVSEGQFNNGDGTISCYDMVTGECTNEIFENANGFRMGNVAQSMTVHGDKAWVVMNNSNVIYAVGLSDMKVKGMITGIVSPRNIHFVSDTKAYVTAMYGNKIYVVNPRTYQLCYVKDEVTGYDVQHVIDVGGEPEGMLQEGGFLYVNLWSYGREIVKIDLSTDKVTARLAVGVQPCDMVMDADGRLWVLTDGGGWEDNPAGYEKPALHCMDPGSFKVVKTFEFKDFVPVSRLDISKDGKTLYWLGGGVWRMDSDAPELPSGPFIKADGKSLYSLTVSPDNGDVFVGDAIDYTQNGKVYRYSAEGKRIDVFQVGVCPGNFCWY